MSKRTISKWWFWGVVATIPGWILILPSALTLAAHLGKVTPVTFPFVPDDYSRTMVGLILLGGAVAAAGLVAQVVAWIGAVVNTNLFTDKTWFNVLLWVGIAGIVAIPLFGLGFLISGSLMIAYLVGGPDGTAPQQPVETATATPPSMLVKRTIAAWLIGGAIAVTAGPIFALFVSHATNRGGLLQGVLWPSLALINLGFSVAACGTIAVSIAWWGSLFNAHRFADRAWFNLLLWSGIIGALTSPAFGLGVLVWLGAVIAFLSAGPDGMVVQPPRVTTPAAPPRTLVPTS